MSIPVPSDWKSWAELARQDPAFDALPADAWAAWCPDRGLLAHGTQDEMMSGAIEHTDWPCYVLLPRDGSSPAVRVMPFGTAKAAWSQQQQCPPPPDGAQLDREIARDACLTQ